MELEIDSLIRLIKRRNPEALEKVMDLYMDSVYSLVKAILFNKGSEEDTEECVQDVFLDAWNNIEKYNPERGSFKTWLLILCKSRALNRRKSLINKGKVIELDERLASSKEDLEENYLAKENKEEIIERIKSMNAVDREIFLRRYILEESIEDICIVMNLSRQAVDNRLWRGRKQLRETFKPAERRSINE
ncbi:MAG: sigma-70 family RNA polymerase sigma factor [Bacillota bacterium]|nr:sigma-70 family RNA polymerase sigma factor [Bacillota bacterium]